MNTNNSARVKKSEHSLLLLNPVATLQFRPLPHAKRLKDLNNKKIGLYWNYKAQGDVALNRVKELLSERFQGMSFEWFMTGSTEKRNKNGLKMYGKAEWME